VACTSSYSVVLAVLIICLIELRNKIPSRNIIQFFKWNQVRNHRRFFCDLIVKKFECFISNILDVFLGKELLLFSFRVLQSVYPNSPR
jgi:hypothetical protein